MTSATSPPAGFPRLAIDACLDRISRSPQFCRSRRLARFLRFTVEELLDGHADQLKERTIGVEVYERHLEYDPRTDPIVRSEAHRLRARLAAYYAREGIADPIVIDLPKGSYVPELRPSTTWPGQESDGCRLIVPDFEVRGGEGPDRVRADALAQALRDRLSALPGLQVLHEVGQAHLASAHLEADYRVEGTLGRIHGQGSLRVRLVRVADEEEIWSKTDRFGRGGIGEVDAALTEPIATAIAATLTRTQAPPGAAGHRAHDLYVKGRHAAIQYSNTLDPRHLEPARRRLAEALQQEPEYVEALAELAHLELLRLYPPRGQTAQVLAKARAYLERALVAAPRHPRSLYLLGHVEGALLRPREALRLVESAVAIDPEDPEGRTMLAVRYASLGFWESALVSCEWARALDPVWEAAHRIQAYLLIRMDQLDGARPCIDELARIGSAPTEAAIARFDLRIAEDDFDGAQAALASLESTFALRPDQEDRRAIAYALADALQGRHREARALLESHCNDGPRFWDHAIRLALALGQHELARKLVLENPINRSYRWLCSEPLVRPHLHRPSWRALAEDLHEAWLSDLDEMGARLPAPPAVLPEPAVLLRSRTRSPLAHDSVSGRSPSV